MSTRTVAPDRTEVKPGRQPGALGVSLSYPFCNLSAAANWFAHRGTTAACPVVAPTPAPTAPAAGLVLEPTPVSDLRRAMTGLNYPVCNILDAQAYHATHGTVAGCPVVDAEDVEAIDQAADRDAMRAEADVEQASPPAEWPAWTDADRWGLGPDPVIAGDDDRAWWTQNAPGNRHGFTVRRADATPVRLSRPRRFDPTAPTDVREGDLDAVGSLVGHHG